MHCTMDWRFLSRLEMLWELCNSTKCLSSIWKMSNMFISKCNNYLYIHLCVHSTDFISFRNLSNEKKNMLESKSRSNNKHFSLWVLALNVYRKHIGVPLQLFLNRTRIFENRLTIWLEWKTVKLFTKPVSWLHTFYYIVKMFIIPLSF